MCSLQGSNIISISHNRSAIISDSVFIADGARIIGSVIIGENSSVWFNAVLRGDGDSITIGSRSNVQDNVTIHVDAGAPAIIGNDVSIGHNAVVHGATIESGSLIGIGAVVLSRAVIGAGTLVAAGAVVLEGTIVPPHSLVAGVPAQVKRLLSPEEGQGLIANSASYVDRVAWYRQD